MRHAVLAAVLAFAPTPGLAEDATMSLTVLVDGGRPNTGQIIATLFASEEAYMKAPSAEITSPVDPGGRARLVFTGLEDGEYAVSVIYDENANGELDTNFLGIPTEEIGFSNNAKPFLGPAPYDKARFRLTAETSEITIALRGARAD